MIRSFDDFLNHLHIPDTCRLDTRVPKKRFLESGLLDAADKKCLKNDIERIRWLYTLKPATINIASYNDSEREYPEVAVLHVKLNKISQTARIAHFINRSIPYPLLLLFTNQENGTTLMSITLADKRINQADNQKWVLEDSVNSGWLDFADQSASETEFLRSLRITALPFTNFFHFYRAVMDRVIAVSCAHHSGIFRLDKDGNRLDKLRRLEKMNAEKTEIANKLKKEKRLGRQVELNIKVKRIKESIAQVKGSL